MLLLDHWIRWPSPILLRVVHHQVYEDREQKAEYRSAIADLCPVHAYHLYFIVSVSWPQIVLLSRSIPCSIASALLPHQCTTYVEAFPEN
jgi:hypothetical protein